MLASREAIYGVDFSGAMDAERKIWIARGIPRGSGLTIDDCAPLAELCPAVEGPQGSARALADLIQRQPGAAFALDFPFGLPRALLPPRMGWSGFIRSFQKTYPSPGLFRDACRRASPRGEHSRITDTTARTPFCPYNLRIYRQTWYGIAHLLTPLLAPRAGGGAVCVPPMQPLEQGKPWLLEICPASTLKAMGCYRRFPKYKQTGAQSRGKRGQILAAITEAGPLTYSSGLKQTILGNTGGDALDSVIAAFTAFKLLQAPRLPEIPPESRKAALREAWVYSWPNVKETD